MLPKVEDGEELTVGSLAVLALDFKVAFREDRPNDFDDFDLLISAEMKLGNLALHYKNRGRLNPDEQRTSSVVVAAFKTLHQLMEEGGESLYGI